MSSNELKNKNKFTAQPKLVEKLLGFILSREDAEILLGDFAEEFFTLTSKYGLFTGRILYWFGVIKSMRSFMVLSENKFTRSYFMYDIFKSKNDKKIAVTGLVLIVPAILLCVGGLLQAFFGITSVSNALNYQSFIFSPFIILVGLFVAFVINLLSIFHIKYQDGDIVSTLHIKGKLINLVIIGAITFLGSIIFLYLLVENF